MGGFDDYTAFQATVASYLGRDDLTAQIIDWIFLAEIGIAQDLMIDTEQGLASGALTSGVDTLAAPSDLLEPTSLQIIVAGAPVPLTIVAPPVSVMLKDTVPARPATVRLRGVEFVLSPTPDADYAYVLEYIKGPVHLSGSVATTELLTRYPSALLHRTLLESAPYNEGDARVELWLKGYDTAMKAARRTVSRRKLGAGPLTVRPLGPTP